MRKVLKALCFVFGAVLCLGVVSLASETLAPVYPEMRARVALFRGRTAEVRVVTVGNSHSRGLDFAAIGLPGIHFWGVGHDMFEAAHLARFAARRAPHLRYVLMSASFDGHYLDHAAISSQDLMGIRREMYARAFSLEYIPGDFNLWLAGTLAPVARADHWRGAAERLFHGTTPVNLDADGSVGLPDPAPLSARAMEESSEDAARRHYGLTGETLSHDRTTPARAAAALDGLVRDLGRSGVLLVLHTPPYHESYRRHFPEGQAHLRESLIPLLARHRNVVWLDFSADPAFTSRVDLFRNGDHLNSRGARAYSQRLGRCLRILETQGGAANQQGCQFVGSVSGL